MNPTDTKQTEVLEIALDRFCGVLRCRAEAKCGTLTLRCGEDGGNALYDAGSPPLFQDEKYRFLVFDILYKNPHAGVIKLDFYRDTDCGRQSDLEVFVAVLPNFPTRFCFDLAYLDGQTIFLPRTPGRLKGIVVGNRIEREEIKRFSLGLQKSAGEQEVEFSNLRLTAELPDFPLPNVKLSDELGQLATIDWRGKTHGQKELTDYLRTEYQKTPAPMPGRSGYGGALDLTFEASGYFRTAACQNSGRWYLCDPDGHAFFSVGFDCTSPGSTCKITGIQDLFEALPPEHAGWVRGRERDDVNFTIWNLYRAFGGDWRVKWTELTEKRLRKWGVNTVANWSDAFFIQNAGMPYVMPLGNFPTAKETIFRDFPDVFSDEYAENSATYAKQLLPYRADRNLIGYFMANEPHWAFCENLNLAEELLQSGKNLASREFLLHHLKEKYKGDISALNAAWRVSFPSFERLRQPLKHAAALGAAAKRDLQEFSAILVDRYVRLPCAALKAVDPNHLNLGMRYAFMSSDSLLAGSDYFDVYSINCYQNNPSEEITRIGELSGKPVMIGEFHFGTIDCGMIASGLRGALNQQERANAYRLYLEHALANKHCVGAHYFTLYDQHVLGRFDGENFGIGLLDVCGKPYPEFEEAVIKTGERMYDVARGTVPPFNEPVKYIPRIGF
ncbi:MAG: beta-galactosidase [Clostridiales bacterium]|jgi:hypothetical protein|nr:beta-galactosidase [Clostridiales bacterium]